MKIKNWQIIKINSYKSKINLYYNKKILNHNKVFKNKPYINFFGYKTKFFQGIQQVKCKTFVKNLNFF